MAGVLLLAMGVCLSGAVALVLWLTRQRPPGKVVVSAAALHAAGARRIANRRRAGVIAGLLVGGAAATWGALGRGWLLAGPVFGLCVLAGVVAGELSVRPAAGPTRAALVEVRRLRDYLPRGLATAVMAAATGLLALVTVTTATAGPDDLGRPGRVLLLRCGPGLWQDHGPWPGSFYSVPLAMVVAAGLIGAGGALRIVIRRARSGADPAVVAADDALRQRSARAITGACGILVALPLAGTCLVSAGALLSFSCHPVWWSYAGWALLALLIPVLALLAWCAAALLAPAHGITAARPAR
jgi:hypothetical protein